MGSRTARVGLIVGLVVALLAVVGVAGAAGYVAGHSDGDHPMDQNHGNHGDTQMSQNHDDHPGKEQGGRNTHEGHADHAHGSCGR